MVGPLTWALLSVSIPEWILCDNKWISLMEVTSIITLHLRLLGYICNSFRAALCFKVFIYLTLGSWAHWAPVPGSAWPAWMWELGVKSCCCQAAPKPCAGAKTGPTTGFGNVVELFGFMFACSPSSDFPLVFCKLACTLYYVINIWCIPLLG